MILLNPIRIKTSGKKKKKQFDNKQQKLVMLTRNKKKYCIKYRLVAIAFCPT